MNNQCKFFLVTHIFSFFKNGKRSALMNIKKIKEDAMVKMNE
jgi:hypothetical protein